MSSKLVVTRFFQRKGAIWLGSCGFSCNRANYIQVFHSFLKTKPLSLELVAQFQTTKVRLTSNIQKFSFLQQCRNMSNTSNYKYFSNFRDFIQHIQRLPGRQLQQYRWCGIWTRSIVSLSFSICRLTVLHVKVICFVRLFASGVGPSSSALKAAFRSSSGVQRYQFALSLWKRSNARKFSCFFLRKTSMFFSQTLFLHLLNSWQSKIAFYPQCFLYF